MPDFTEEELADADRALDKAGQSPERVAAREARAKAWRESQKTESGKA